MKPTARGERRAAMITLFGLVLGLGGGATNAAFSWTTGNGANSLATAPDWTAPTATASVIAKSGSTTGGTINQGSTYYVYANVTDSGNPAAGVSSVTANLVNITAGQAAAALTTTGSPWTVDGTSYAYRSALIIADNPLSSGVKAYTLTLTDASSPANVATQSGFSVTVSNGPTGIDIQATNGGGNPGKPEANDTVTYTYSTAMAPGSIKSGWTGVSTTVDVTIGNNTCGPSNDALLVYAPGTNTLLNVGQVCLGVNFANGNNKTFANSTMVMSGNSVVITLAGTVNSIKTSTSAFAMQWTPSASSTDTSGNPCSAAIVTESGTNDLDF